MKRTLARRRPPAVEPSSSLFEVVDDAPPIWLTHCAHRARLAVDEALAATLPPQDPNERRSARQRAHDRYQRQWRSLPSARLQDELERWERLSPARQRQACIDLEDWITG